MPANYKEKANGLVLLVEKRTQEAKGWKQVAEGRLMALKELSASVQELESILVRTPLGSISSIPQETVYDPIIDAASVKDGISTIPDLVSFAKAFIDDIASTVGATDAILSAATGTQEEDLSVPADAYEGLHDFSSLTLEEMGAYQHHVAGTASPEVTFDPITQEEAPPSPPVSTGSPRGAGKEEKPKEKAPKEKTHRAKNDSTSRSRK